MLVYYNGLYLSGLLHSSRALFSAPLFNLLTCHFLKICFNLNAHFGENLEVNKADDVSAY